jgi:hypothetical protein
MSIGDKHGPFWALFGKNGEPNMQLIKKPGPWFLDNAKSRGQRVGRVVLTEVHPDIDAETEKSQQQ